MRVVGIPGGQQLAVHVFWVALALQEACPAIAAPLAISRGVSLNVGVPEPPFNEDTFQLTASDSPVKCLLPP